MTYDAVIIGTGPAGLSVALNLKIHEKNFIWYGSKSMSEKVLKADTIFNYPGFPEISGADLNQKFIEHAEKMGIEIEEKMVTRVMKMGDVFYVSAQEDMVETKSVVMTMGVFNTGTFGGEDELVGRGVSYCATCDGMLYKGKNIGVYSNSKRFEHEVKFLADIADKVYYLPAYKGNEVTGDNVELLPSGIDEVEKSDKGTVSGLKLKNGEEVGIDGLFCLRTAIAPTTLMPELEVENGHIKVNRNMETNIPGVYAAGDCTGRPYQYTKAVGEGNVAAHSLLEYISE